MLGFGGSWPPLCYELSQWHFHRNFFPNDMTRNRFYGPVRWLPNGFIAKTWFWFFLWFFECIDVKHTDIYWWILICIRLKWNFFEHSRFLIGLNFNSCPLVRPLKTRKTNLTRNPWCSRCCTCCCHGLWAHHWSVVPVGNHVMGVADGISLRAVWRETIFSILYLRPLINGLVYGPNMKWPILGPEPPRHFGANHVANPTICQTSQSSGGHTSSQS